MKKVLFIDRDGTLAIEPPIDYQLDSLEKLEFYPRVFQWLSKIAIELDYELVMVTNQDGLGTTSFPEETFWPAQNKMLEILASEGKASSKNNLNSVSSHLGLTYRVNPPDGNSKIQVALLFDTSNSMDGLIEQAKSRLWDIVNTLTTLKYQGKTPVIEIALYEYGNDGLSVRNNYIRQVTALTTDLDLISENVVIRLLLCYIGLIIKT